MSLKCGNAKSPGAGSDTEISTGDGEEEEDPSSSLHPLLSSIHVRSTQIEAEEDENVDESESEEADDALSLFRLRWKQELKHKGHSPVNSGNGSGRSSNGTSPDRSLRLTRNSSTSSFQDDIFEKAKILFRQGIDFEQKGLMHDAIKCYHQSVHLMPDIEQRLFRSSAVRSGSNQVSGSCSPMPSHGSDSVVRYNESTYDQDFDLLPIFEARLYYSNGERLMCRPYTSHTGLHMSALPVEVMLHVFKWVVGSDLDVRVLEQLTLVCCGFYVLARDPEIWRLVCCHTWGIRTGILDALYPTWRLMYLGRPHLWHNGLYISKMTYVRHGETSFQDQFYRPWHLVIYYRYIRFFPDGTVIMLTSPEEPTIIVPYFDVQNSRYPGVMRGHYRLMGKDCVSGKVYRKKPENTVPERTVLYGRRKPQQLSNYELVESSFSFEFKIGNNRRGRRNVQLMWLDYESYIRYRSGQDCKSKFDLDEQSFPPLIFSRVKSYTRESERALTLGKD